MTIARPRIGLVGLGMMGRNHARVIAHSEHLDFVGIADPRADRETSAQGRPMVDSVDELIDMGLDLCVVALPTEGHLRVASTLASAQVSALIEKPLARTVEECNAIITAFDAAESAMACVGHIERFNPAIQELKLRVADGTVGEVHQFGTRRQGPYPDRVRDVGVVKDLATHDLDLATYVLGSRFRSVAAQASTMHDGPYEDLVAITGQLEGGVVTNHLVNWVTPVKERTVSVTGERGCLVADLLTADLTFHATPLGSTDWPAISNLGGVSRGQVTRYAIDKIEPLRSELESFVAAATNGPDSRGATNQPVTLREGRDALRTAEAVLQSAATGQTVTLDGLAEPGEGSAD